VSPINVFPKFFVDWQTKFLKSNKLINSQPCKIKTLWSSETAITIHQSTRRNAPHDLNIQKYENPPKCFSSRSRVQLPIPWSEGMFYTGVKGGNEKPKTAVQCRRKEYVEPDIHSSLRIHSAVLTQTETFTSVLTYVLKSPYLQTLLSSCVSHQIPREGTLQQVKPVKSQCLLHCEK
jgi:hypothetical protein